MGLGDRVSSPFAGKSATFFLVAGVVFLATSANTWLLFLVEGYEQTTVTQTLLGVALLSAVFGLAGLYSGLARRTPWLARVGLAVALLAAVDVFLLVVWGFADTASVGPPLSPVVTLTTPLLMIVGFLVFGIATVRADGYPTPAGVLLLAEAGALVALIAIPVLVFEGAAPMWGAALIEATQGLILLGTGYVLRRDEPRGRHEGSATPARTVS